MTVDVRSREPLDRIEIVANGRVVQQFPAPEGKTSFHTEVTMESGEYTWVAARCFEKSGATVRMAHSKPVFFNDAVWDARLDAQYFVDWIDELMAQTKQDAQRFSNEDERNAVLSIYQQARSFYQNKTY